ncbi:antibiotic biosynthesis monooxygenase [Chroococcidiopsis sp. CCMEE 29]|uniref:antibiotic biosynthesis monooxygenase family protein n=1 Tax=Chroococcidiopsis sp. CCMEE 29 TaxID=155894 RepID=UPI0020204B19|nr:antibiotic biosynthesis monooxygenase [Chroococcidiopsis sp. CCMEE 29]
MPTIHENQFFTVLVEFEVDPSQQYTFINEIAEQVEQHFKSYAGFVSASFHASDDGQRVVNYAQWQSKEAWQDSFHAPNRNEVQTSIDELISRCGAKTLNSIPFASCEWSRMYEC